MITRKISAGRWQALAASAAAVALVTTGASLISAPAQADPAALAPVASAGCAAPAAAPGKTVTPFAADGRTGSYIEDVPPATTGPLPLVIDLHGYLEPAALEHLGSGLSAYGNTHGFATVTPEISESGYPRWDFSQGSGDVAYLSDLLTDVEHTLCVDLRRVYVAGLSMGAFTTSSLACQLSDRIAAVAPVAGVQSFSWCDPVRPVPVVAFHGTDDPLVAYNGGPGANAHLLPGVDSITGPGPGSIPDHVANWAQRNGCGAQATDTQVTPDVTHRTYPCPAGADVELYSIAGGGHTWPGYDVGIYPAPLVGRTTLSIDADAIMWDFFRAHPLTGPVGR